MKAVSWPDFCAAARSSSSSASGSSMAIALPFSSTPSSPSAQAATIAVPRRIGPPAVRLSRTVPRTNFGIRLEASCARRKSVSAIASLVKRLKSVLM